MTSQKLEPVSTTQIGVNRRLQSYCCRRFSFANICKMIFVCWCPRNFRKLRSVADDTELNLEGQLKKFSLQELQVATDGFSNENMLSSDGYGPFGKAYKGILQDGSLVAIKRLKRDQTPGGELQFQKVMTMVSMAVHQNLLKLLGVCITSEERLLVYPYLVNGSVASLLRDRSPLQPSLDWSIRKRIALESAKGISFLHEHYNIKIIHGDVKAANVFLNENLDVFIGGFALAKLIDNKDTHITSAVRGTIGYIAPEFLSSGRCSEKIDIYSYGIMLLELITGQKAFDISRLSNDDDIMLIDWLSKFDAKVERVVNENKLEMLVDPNLQTNYVEAEMEQLIQVAILCTQASPEYRPKMSEVVRMVESIGLADRWDEWQNMDISHHELGLVLNPRAAFDSTQYLPAVELSGPR